MNNSVTCPSCSTTEFEIQKLPSILLQLPDKFKISKCKCCELIQLLPRPTIDDYELHYKESQYYSPEDYNARANKRIPIFKARLEDIEKYIGKKENRKIIDYGCAGGHFLKEAIQSGWTTIGIEYTDKLAENARSLTGNDSVYKELSAIKDKIKVDVVHSNHVFEHLPDPLTTAKEIHSVLQHDGILFIEVPHQFSSWIDLVKLSLIRCLGEKIAFKFFKSGVDSLHHTFFYSPKTLKEILVKSGFSIIYCSTFNPAYYKKSSSILGIKRIPYYFMDKLFSFITRGGNIICVAKKI
jgi:2-polyprenyl-3-methyl-5-hydroxy-6-metoxy-1,4-benzoquinol methylase